MRWVMRAVFVVTAPALVPAQEPVFEVVLRDGSTLAAVAIENAAADRVKVTTPLRPEERPWSQVLSIHGRSQPDSGLPSIMLAGGEVLRGAIVGGDTGGDFCDVESRSVGRVRVRVDRIECVLLRDDLAAMADLKLPDGVDEALFTKAGVGFDLQAGAIFQFAPQGVSFQPDGEDRPRWFRWADLVGIRLRDPEKRSAPAPVDLVTSAGDRLGVEIRQWHRDRIEVALEDGKAMALRPADIASVLFVRDVVPLSRLQPRAVAEAGFEGEVLWTFARDRAVGGGLLRCGGFTYGSGLGVHARSRLRFTVPDGVQYFWTRVGVDDAVLALPVRGDVDVQVLHNDRPVFAQVSLRSGHAPHSTGLLAVRPGDTIELFADFGKGRELGDRVDWLGAVFLAGERR